MEDAWDDFEDTNLNKDQWKGEDEDDVMENWDDDSEEEKEKEAAKEAPKVAPKQGGKKYLKQLLKEKEEKEAKEQEARITELMNKTSEQKLADKLNAQKLAEDSDFMIAKEGFAGKENDSNVKTLDNFKPSTKADFKEMSEMMISKFASFEDSPHYSYVFETVVKQAMIALKAEDLRKLSTSISVLANEKQKLEKNQKKKKSKKPTLSTNKRNIQAAVNTYDDYGGDDGDFDDFM